MRLLRKAPTMDDVMVRTTVSAEELGQKGEALVERVEQGELAVIASAGRERAVLLDATAYRLLRALAACDADAELVDADVSPSEVAILRDFLAERINLGKAAELLGLPRLVLSDRFHRLGVPLRLGPASLAEARAEVAAALRHG